MIRRLSTVHSPNDDGPFKTMMMKFLPKQINSLIGFIAALCLLCLATQHRVHAQCTDVFLFSQTDVDNFNCTSISGSLYILGGDDLSPLSVLESVGLDVFISAGSLANLNGMSGLTSVGGSFFIGPNDALENVDGLSALATVGGGLVLIENFLLQNVDGLSALESVGGLDVSSNPALTDLNGLSGLTTVSGDLNIYNNPNLATVGGLSALASVTGGASIGYNPMLANVNGLNALATVGAGLTIESNAMLANLGGLVGLTTVTGPLGISSNPLLANVNGLSALTGTGGLTVENNAILSNLNGLSALANVGGDVYIAVNPQLANVDGLSAVTGVTGFLVFEANNMLANLNGLSALANVDGDFVVAENPVLANVDGLAALATVGGALVFEANATLANLEGLTALTAVTGDLYIAENPLLANVDGLAALATVGGDLIVAENAVLSECCGIHNVVNYGVSGSITIEGNHTGCDNQASINAACDTDGDGVGLLTDCDDGDPNNFPGNPEVCDGQDNNCNVDIDEGTDGSTFVGDVVFSDQAGLDAWLPCFSIIDGDLTISGPDITDLSPLDNLAEVTGNLYIEDNPALTELSGFPLLATIGDDFYIEGNDALMDVTGFGALMTAGRLLISGNALLEDVTGFPVFTSTDQLTIEENEALAEVTGFAGLATVGYLGIEYNPNLLGITGFSTGSFTVGDLSIENNDLLADISGFSSLTAVDGEMNIRDNPSLNDVSGFAGLTTIGTDLAITQNTALTDVSGFAALQSVAGEFSIRRNIILTNVSGFAALETVGDRFEISDNIFEEDDFGPSPTGEKGSTGSNKLLVGMSGFGNLTTVGVDFQIRNNMHITSINGFSALSTVGGNFEINQNAALTEVSGFSALSSVEYSFEISDNPMLTALSGFTALTVAEEIAIQYNEMLTNIGAFTALDNLDGGIQISENAQLTNLDCFAHLASLTGYLTVADNPSLTDCCAIYELISTPGAVGGSIYINNNNTGCDNVTEVEINCEDADGDGVNIYDGDCDDDPITGPNNFPGNAEICDGIDNNCNSEVDEYVPCTGPGTRTWTGFVDTDWDTPCNWEPGCVPTVTDDVIIPYTANDPVIMDGSAGLAKSVHVQTGALLTIENLASLTINGFASYLNFTAGLRNQGTVENSGQLTLGSTASVGRFGIFNQRTFNNNPSGEISIDRSTQLGLYNAHTFTNTAKITIGAMANVGDHGISNYSTFNNNPGGEISIDRSTGLGLYNGGFFINAAKITIGAMANVGVHGISNYSTFNNDPGGEISIDRSTEYGLWNYRGTFTNESVITIGSIAPVGLYGISNENYEDADGPTYPSFINSACATLTSFAPVFNSSTFTNDGLFTASTTDTHTNTTTINNNGIITYPQGNPIPNVTNNEIIIAPNTFDGCDVISPAFTFGGIVDFTILGVYTDAAGNNPAGSYDVGTNTFTASPVLTEGLHTLYVKISDAGCTRFVSWQLTTQNCCDAPVANCKPFTVLLVGISVTIGAADVDGGSTADCGLSGLVISQNQFDCSHVGTPQTVTLTITDINNESDDCDAIVTVVDYTPPTATCPISIPDVVIGANGNGTLPANIGDGSSTDNCGANLTETSPDMNFDCANVGPQTVILTASDGVNSATATCSFNVVDNQAPTATCPGPIPDVVLDTEGNGALPANIGDGSSTDNCGVATETSPAASFTCADLGSQTVILTADDGHGNTNTAACSFNVVDSQAPTATCPASIPDVALNADGSGTLPANIGDGSSTDNCGANLTETSPALNFTCANAGPHTVVLTASDGVNSATASCAFTVLPFITNISVAHTNETCAGAGNGTITATATAAGGQVKYSTDGVNFQASGLFANLGPGVYTVTIKVFGVPNTCVEARTETVGPGGPLTTWYKDNDNDGHSDGVSQTGCDRPTGYKTPAELNGQTSGDCNDNNPSAYPGQTWYKDTDNDNYTDGTTQTACLRPAGHKTASELVNTTEIDCNDNNAAINHGATETCNGIDDDCDGQIDEGTSGGLTWTGNVYFGTQQQVDDWSACYSVINGSATINGTGINNLGPLSNITEVTGGLTIQSTGLANLNGLNALGNVGGTVFIYFNSSLTSVGGLNALATVGGAYYMYYNFQLNSCCAVHNLINGGVTGPISIFYNKVGCNSVADINANCSQAPLVGGNGGDTFATANGQQVASKEMALYPNPAHAEVTVRFGQTGPAATMRITDLLGRVVFEKEIEEGVDRLTINLRDGVFENGLYLVALFEDGEMRVKQLVVQQ